MFDPELSDLLKQYVRQALQKKSRWFEITKDSISTISTLLGLPTAMVAVIGLVWQTDRADKAKVEAATQTQITQQVIAAAPVAPLTSPAPQTPVSRYWSLRFEPMVTLLVETKSGKVTSPIATLRQILAKNPTARVSYQDFEAGGNVSLVIAPRRLDTDAHAIAELIGALLGVMPKIEIKDEPERENTIGIYIAAGA
jgi:hypothetical protein